MDEWVTSIVQQFPIVGLVLFLFHRFKLAQDEARERFLGYLAGRDADMKESLIRIR